MTPPIVMPRIFDAQESLKEVFARLYANKVEIHIHIHADKIISEKDLVEDITKAIKDKVLEDMNFGDSGPKD